MTEKKLTRYALEELEIRGAAFANRVVEDLTREPSPFAPADPIDEVHATLRQFGRHYSRGELIRVASNPLFLFLCITDGESSGDHEPADYRHAKSGDYFADGSAVFRALPVPVSKYQGPPPYLQPQHFPRAAPPQQLRRQIELRWAGQTSALILHPDSLTVSAHNDFVRLDTIGERYPVLLPTPSTYEIEINLRVPQVSRMLRDLFCLQTELEAHTDVVTLSRAFIKRLDFSDIGREVTANCVIVGGLK